MPMQACVLSRHFQTTSWYVPLELQAKAADPGSSMRLMSTQGELTASTLTNCLP